MNNGAIETAKKIKELAEKGVGGEKQNAQELLSKFLKKNNLTLDDLDSEEKKDWFLNDKDFPKEYNWLMAQIVASVDPTLKDVVMFREMLKDKKSQSEIKNTLGYTCSMYLFCTASYYAEISTKFSVYKDSYDKEADLFRYAFFLKNDLLVDKKDGDENSRGFSEDDIKKIIGNAMNIDKVQIHKKIEK